jgi:hypothetical protein
MYEGVEKRVPGRMEKNVPESQKKVLCCLKR